MHPAELLDRRFGGADAIFGNRLAGKADAVMHRLEEISIRLTILDGETDEIDRRPAILPVHPEQHHAVAAMDGQRKKRSGIPAGHTKIRIHARLPWKSREI